MKRTIVYITFLTLVLNLSCKSDKKEETTTENEATTTEAKVEENTTPKNTATRPDNFEDQKKVTLRLESKSKSNVTGSVIFKQDKGMVTMIAVMSGLSQGEHAIHLHEKADCSSDDGKSSGGHWNPTGQPHGKWGAESGYHKGDIGNFNANADGNATITKITDEWCIGCGDETKDILGKAVIVHQGVDDYTSQPSGAAGSRISCGGIIE